MKTTVNDFLYSIIIPFKGDTTRWLERTLGSIPDRTDIQVIVVDDNPKPITISTGLFQKATLEILVPEEHHGAGHARNVALTHVRGRFLLFCDADDIFTENAFSYADAMTPLKRDITFFAVTSIRLIDGKPAKRHLNKQKFFELYRLNSNEDNFRYRWDAPWGKMFLSAFILEGQFCFEETRLGNDTRFSVRTGHAAERIAVCQEVLYVVSDGNGVLSQLTGQRSRDDLFLRYSVMLDKYDYLRIVGKGYCRPRLWKYEGRALLHFGPSEWIRYRKERRRRGL